MSYIGLLRNRDFIRCLWSTSSGNAVFLGLWSHADLWGAFGNIHTIPFMAYVQENIDAPKMGRAFSVVGIVNSLAMPVGLLIGGPVAEKIRGKSGFGHRAHMCIIVTAISMGIERKQ